MKNVLLEQGDVGQSASWPLSAEQQHVWKHARLHVQGNCYAWKLVGRLDSEALQNSLNEMVRKHDVLRASFHLRNGAPVQTIRPYQPLEWTITDLRHAGAEEWAAWIERCLRSLSERPFDLTGDLLIRPSLLRLADEEHLFAIQVHPIVADSWSVKMLLAESLAKTRSFSNAEPNERQALPSSYASYCEQQEERLAKARAEADLAFWKQKLGGEPPELYLPTDYPRSQPVAFAASTCPVVIPSPVQRSVQAFCEREQVSPALVVLTVLNALLRRYGTEGELRVAALLSGRHDPDWEQAIGVFAQPVIVQTLWQDELTFREALQLVRQAKTEACEYQRVPFAVVARELGQDSTGSSQPLYRVMLHAAPALTDAEAEALGLRIFELDAGSRYEGADLVVKVTESGEGLACSLTYAADLFAEETIRRLAGHFVTLLGGDRKSVV